MRAPTAFNPNDPFDATAELMRKRTADLFLQLSSEDGCSGMSDEDILSAFVTGGLVGIVGVAFSLTTAQSRDAMMQAIGEYLPLARVNVEAILDEGTPGHG